MQLTNQRTQHFQFLTLVSPQSSTGHTDTTPSNAQKIVSLLSLHVGLEGSKRVVYDLAGIPRDAALATKAFSDTSWVVSQDLRDKIGHIDLVRTKINANVTIYTRGRLLFNIIKG